MHKLISLLAVELPLSKKFIRPTGITQSETDFSSHPRCELFSLAIKRVLHVVGQTMASAGAAGGGGGGGSLLFNLRKVVLAATEVISLASHLKSLAVACEFILYV